MRFFKRVKMLSASALLAVLVLSQSGCGIILIGAAAGGYLYGKNLKKCVHCGKMINKNDTVCPHCHKKVPVDKK